MLEIPDHTIVPVLHEWFHLVHSRLDLSAILQVKQYPTLLTAFPFITHDFQVAKLVVFLASDDAAMVTGSVYPIDAGYGIKA